MASAAARCPGRGCSGWRRAPGLPCAWVRCGAHAQRVPHPAWTARPRSRWSACAWPADAAVAALAFDLAGRRLTVDHDGFDPQAIPRPPLCRWATAPSWPSRGRWPPADTVRRARRRCGRRRACCGPCSRSMRRCSWWSLAPAWARSAGLIADAMDMFADAAVYGVALYAVGGRRATNSPRGAAGRRCCSWCWRSVRSPSGAPHARRRDAEQLGMMGIALLALAANVACLVLIARHRRGRA